VSDAIEKSSAESVCGLMVFTAACVGANAVAGGETTTTPERLTGTRTSLRFPQYLFDPHSGQAGALITPECSGILCAAILPEL
jgi:hypothetical protein